MAKRTSTDQTAQFTARVYRQHSSLIITLPKRLCEQLQIAKGSHVLFEVGPGDVAAVMGTIALRGSENVRGKRNSDREDQGGRA